MEIEKEMSLLSAWDVQFALAFVTNGALLDIKPIGRHVEHVVALDADAVDNRAYDGAGLGRFGQATGRRSGRLL